MTNTIRMQIIFTGLPGVSIMHNGVVSLTLSTVSPPFGYYFPSDFPEIKKMTRLLDNGPIPARYKEKIFNEREMFFADENLFDVFSVKVLKGNPKTALD